MQQGPGRLFIDARPLLDFVLGLGESLDGMGDELDFFVGHVLVDGEGETFPADLFGDGKRALAGAVSAIGFVEVEGHRIEDGASDLGFLKLLHESFAARVEDGVLVPDMLVSGSGHGGDGFGVGEQVVVHGGDFLAAFGPVVEAVELRAKERRLDFGHPAGVADFVVVVAFAAHTVDAEAEGATFDLVVVGENHSAIAGGAEVFGDIEAKAGGESEVAGVDPVLVGIDDLGGVLEHQKVVLLRDFVECLHVGELAEEVDRHDGSGPRRDGGSDFFGVEVIGDRVDVRKDGDGSKLGHDFGSRDKGKGGDDDFVARLDAAGLEHDAEGVGSGIDGDGVLDTVAAGDALFEFGVVFAEDVGAGFEDFHAPRSNIGLDFVVLGLEVDKVDSHGLSLAVRGDGEGG